MLKEITEMQDRINEITVHLKVLSPTGQELNDLILERKTLLDKLHIAKHKYRTSNQYNTLPKYKKELIPETAIKENENVKEIIKEVIVEKIVYVNSNNTDSENISSEEFQFALNKLRENYIRSHCKFKIDDEININFKWGNNDTVENCIIKEFVIIESEIFEEHKGIYAKVKKYNRLNKTVSQRFLGNDKNGYKITELLTSV